MLNRDHPDDERLSALASGDPEAHGDAALSAHLASCDRCAGVVRDLTVLRTALSELPDVAPNRPLRLLPPVDADAHAPGATAADRLGLWARRLFGPALTAGAMVAMIGLVGTALPAVEEMASGGAAAPSTADGAEAAGEMEFSAESPATREGPEGGTDLFVAPATGEVPEEEAAGGQDGSVADADDAEDRAGERAGETGLADEALPAERSPWPMVLFAGVAVMVAAALLRWIVVPRAG